MGQFYSGMSFGYHRGCGGEDRGDCCLSWSPLSITSLTLCMILWCPWVVPSVKDWYIHCVRRSAITGPSFQQQLDCLIAIKTVVWLYFFVVLVEYAVTSEFPLCGIKKVYQIKYPVLSYDFCSYSVIWKIVTWFAEVLFFSICAFLQVIYCDQACQKLHWFSHKKVCKMLQEQREKHEAESASRLQKQAKGIQTHCITMTLMRSIMTLSCFLGIVPWQHIGLDMFFGNAPYFLHSCYLIYSITTRRNDSSNKLWACNLN